jgi:integration host factor subunit alpha
MNDMTSSEFEALLTAQRSAMNRDASAPVSAETPTLTKAELAGCCSTASG